MLRPALASLALLWTLSFNTAAAEPWIGDGITKKDIGAVEVILADDASGGCWTNLAESEQYARDLLDRNGFPPFDPLVKTKPLNFMDIAVASARGGMCYGAIQIEIGRFIVADAKTYKIALAKAGYIFTGHDNANILVLEQIKKFVTSLPKE